MGGGPPVNPIRIKALLLLMLSTLLCWVGFQIPAADASASVHRQLSPLTFDQLGVDGLFAQLVMIGAQYSDPTASISTVQAGAGGLVFAGQPPSGSGPAIEAGIAALNGDALIPPFMSTDEEGGFVSRLSNVLGALPSPRDMPTEWSPAQTQSELAAYARAMRVLGITMDLAPVLDTAPATDTIADESDRSFSENPTIVSLYGLAFAKGLEQGGVVPVVKHFPGLGHANADTDLGPATDPPLAQLAQEDLIPFENAIRAALPVVMMSNVMVPGLTGDTPASLSPAAYTFLHGLGFNGMTITDSLDAGAISGAGDSAPAASVKAIEAGADMVIVTNASEFAGVVTQLENAFESGQLPISRIVDALVHVLEAKGYSVTTSLSATLANLMATSMSCRQLALLTGACAHMEHRSP
jgi:beta-N-acetylhexosaminidase